MRTIKRCSDVLNKTKIKSVNQTTSAYTKEKKYWLGIFQQHQYIGYTKTHRMVRNQFVSAKYQSHYGLQARMWKLALIDAAETMDKYWQSIFDKVKTCIYQNKNLNEERRHYCFWLLKDYQRLPSILQGKPPEFKGMSYQERKQAICFLQRSIKKYRKSYPAAKLSRSFSLDDNCYGCFEHHGKHYIKIMSLKKGERIVLPLKGHTTIQGNIRVIVKDKVIHIHYTASLKTPPFHDHHEVVGIDLGYTEVLTDSLGNHYGKDFGKNLTEISDWLKNKMQKRNKLHALQTKYLKSEDKSKRKKGKNIQKINLSKAKLTTKIERHQDTSLRLINTAFNEMLDKTKAKIIISEDLSRPFHFGKFKNTNRRLSAWCRHSLNERLSFKALVKGFDHHVVNPAYTSQTCPSCGYVDASNRCSRNKDKFVCLYCGTEGHSDTFAAINLKARYFDNMITRYTPYREVKKILLDRFHHCLETKPLGTVSSRILDTHTNRSTGLGQSESEYQKISNDYV
jgi:putative transposase